MCGEKSDSIARDLLPHMRRIIPVAEEHIVANVNSYAGSTRL
jgi:hypothetical protein